MTIFINLTNIPMARPTIISASAILKIGNKIGARFASGRFAKLNGNNARSVTTDEMPKIFITIFVTLLM
jgi:hypothetical protein